MANGVAKNIRLVFTCAEKNCRGRWQWWSWCVLTIF